MSDVTGKDYLGRHCVLRDATGRVVQEGDKLADFRGKGWRIMGGRAPHKPGSTGFVDAQQVGEHAREFNPTVFDCCWVAG